MQRDSEPRVRHKACRAQLSSAHPKGAERDVVQMEWLCLAQRDVIEGGLHLGVAIKVGLQYGVQEGPQNGRLGPL